MNHFRIALINPLDVVTPRSCYRTEHLGLAYLASSLRKQGYVVKLIDADALDIPEHQVVKELIDFSPQIVGLSPTYLTFQSATTIAREIKSRCRQTHVCMGGHQASFAAEEILCNESFVDSIVRGEGEVALVELANQLSQNDSLKSVASICYREDGRIVQNNAPHLYMSLDDVPFPVRDTLAACCKKETPHAAAVLTSRGCPNKCSYCSTPQFYALSGTKPWRFRSPSNVIEEIQILVERYGVTHFHFCDDNFIGLPQIGVQRACKIAQGLMQTGLKITFEIYVRADSFYGVDESILPLLRKAGLVSVLVGLEAGSQEMLDLYNKRLSPKDNENIVSLLSKYNIAVNCGFIMFNPYVSLRELRENAKFLLEIGQAAFSRYSTNLALLPGTTLKTKAKIDDLAASDASHVDVYDYNYRDPRIANIAKGVYIFHNPAIVEADSLCTHSDQVIHLIKHVIGTHKTKELTSDLRESLLASAEHINQLKTNIAARYHNFFISILGLGESGWNESAYDAYKLEFLKDIKQLTTRLKKVLFETDSIIHRLTENFSCCS